MAALPDACFTFDPSFCFPPYSGELAVQGSGADTEYVYQPGPGGNPYNYQLTYPPPVPAFDCQLSAEVPEFPSSIPLPPRRAVPLGDVINLPHGAIPSQQARASAAGPGKSSTSQPEQQPSGKPKATRTIFGGTDLLQLGRAIVLKKPYFAPHGKIAEAWKQVNKYLVDNGFRHKVQYTVLQSKAKALIAFKKDPDGEDAAPVASQLQGDAGILIAAVLEQMEQQYDDAKDKSDEAKSKLLKKTEDDRVAGEAIRAASMRGRKRAASRSSSPDSADPDTDPEPTTRAPKKSPAAALSADSSVEIIEDGDSKRQTKRRKMDRRTDSVSATADIIKILEKDMVQRNEHQQETAATMKRFVDEAKEDRGQIINLLNKLIDTN
ncbi:hypothetical protein DFH07DRAFT_956169 [Mycena maculata]|uniref:Uncharacterized protein n=1 Tax=Mycena maculata TaxID=230809 RepID=A0AAD7NJ49_9AGAR|nr:hypothetical protein DFH07DRAFT_956169 [Mycena maculata]